MTIADGPDICDDDLRFEFKKGSDLDTANDEQTLAGRGIYMIYDRSFDGRI